LFCVGPSSTGTATTRAYEMDVVDEGELVSGTLVDLAVPTPPAESFDTTFTMTTHNTYTQYGSVSDPYKPYFIRAGLGGSSRYRSYIQVPQAARDLMSGATVTDIQIRLTQAADNHGVSPYFGTASSGGGTVSNLATRSFSTSMSPGKTGWVTLTTAQRAALAAGTLYVVVGRADSSNTDTLVSYYGTSSGTSSYRPRIRIKGSK